MDMTINEYKAYNEYLKLTDSEREELGERIAAGHVTPRPSE